MVNIPKLCRTSMCIHLKAERQMDGWTYRRQDGQREGGRTVEQLDRYILYLQMTKQKNEQIDWCKIDWV